MGWQSPISPLPGRCMATETTMLVAMTSASRSTHLNLTTLRALVAAHDGPGIVAWCLEHGGFHAAADPYTLRWVSPCGMADVAVGPERGFDLQVLRLGEAILAS